MAPCCLSCSGFTEDLGSLIRPLSTSQRSTRYCSDCHSIPFGFFEFVNRLSFCIVIKDDLILFEIGFLSFDTDKVPGNAGILDQIEALRWVNKNIGAFGGDSSQVTIAGETA